FGSDAIRTEALGYEGLPAAIVAKGFLAVEPERVHDRQVVEGEEAGVVAGGGVDMLMPGPGRNAEDVALLPVEALAVDDRVTPPLGDLINKTAGVTVRACAFARPQHLHRCADRLHHRSAGHRIHVVHENAVIRRTVSGLGVAL